MNLVKLIEEQLTNTVLGKLSSALGTEPDATGQAATAAVPTLLAGLTKLGSSNDGINRLTSVLGGLDASGLGNYSQMLGGDTSGLLNKGMGMLSSLFGDGIIGSTSAAISRYSGLDAGIVKKLIAFLAPMVLGKVASQWKSQGGTPSALTSLLADQKRHIIDALPAGFSLDSIPGLTDATEYVRSATDSTRRAAETTKNAAPSAMNWILPVAGVLLVGFLLWQFMKSRSEAGREVAQSAAREAQQVTAMKPAVPETPNLPSVSQLTDELNSTFKTLGETFSGIKDAASAEAAAPKLEQLSAKIDVIKKTMAALPEAGRATLHKVVDGQLKPIKDSAQQTLSLPGLSERIKLLINQIITKLEDWQIIKATG
jgi:hypothetical protein